MADRIENTSSGTTKAKARGGKALLSKGRLFITAFIVAMVMFYAVLGMSYLSEGEKQEELTYQIAEVSQTLREIPQPPEDLEEQLAVAQTSFTTEQNSFPGEINTIQLIESILELAQFWGVDATPMATEPWVVEMVGTHNYPVLRLTIAVEGGFSQISMLTSDLENEDYATLIIEDLSVTRGSEENEEGIIPVTGSLELAIYARSLSSE